MALTAGPLDAREGDLRSRGQVLEVPAWQCGGRRGRRGPRLGSGRKRSRGTRRGGRFGGRRVRKGRGSDLLQA
eukprot:1193994-Prorocentrum_minimum.AAC.6